MHRYAAIGADRELKSSKSHHELVNYVSSDQIVALAGCWLTISHGIAETVFANLPLLTFPGVANSLCIVGNSVGLQACTGFREAAFGDQNGTWKPPQQAAV
jgi:hypothetical protein